MGRDKPLIDWDKLEDAEVDNSRAGENYRATAHGLSSAGRHIGLGLILAATISVFGWIGYLEFKEFQIRQANQARAQQVSIELERQRQETTRRRAIIAERNAAIERRNQETREVRAMNRRECRYWRGQYSKLKTPEIRAMMKKHC